jgi:hypothetical protein
MDIIYLIKIAMGVLATFALLVLIYFGIEGIRILMSVRRIADRIELMTDIKGWFLFFRKFSRSRRKKKD